MRALFLLLALAAPLSAEDVWTLRTGPTAVEGIPLDPVQPVPAWKGQYADGVDAVWVYVTRSPHFFPPRSPEVVVLTGTPWTAVLFFPRAWKASERSVWTAAWQADFTTLFSLPDPGFPVVFPAVLRKG